MTKTIEVRQQVTVTVDENKFTPEFMGAFRKSFYDFETIEEHIEHIAQAGARGIVSWPGDFLEGYGKLNDFGVTFKVGHAECEVLS